MLRESCRLRASCAKSLLPSSHWPLCPPGVAQPLLREPSLRSLPSWPTGPWVSLACLRPGSAGVQWSLPKPGSPGLASVNLLSGCLSKPIKTNH